MHDSSANLSQWSRIERRLLSIQYIRGGAAVVVLTAHGIPSLPTPVLTKMGMALDFFFVVSGFLFVVISDERTRPAQFLADRLLRIVPLYWTLTLLSAALIYSGILAPVLNPVTLAASIPSWDWSFILRSMLFIPTKSPFTDDLNDLHPLIPQGWTLNYEAMFYVLFAAALCLSRRRAVPVATAVCAALVLLGATVEGGPAFKFYTSPIIFEFVFGMWAGVAWQRGWDFRMLFAAYALSWIILSIVIDFYFMDWPFSPDRITAFPDLLVVLGLFLFLIGLDRREGGIKEVRPLRAIGDAGYSIYLFHFIPIILADRLDDRFVIPPLLYFIIVWGGGIFGGLACYRWVEKPFTRLAQRLRPWRRTGRPVLAQAPA